MCGRCCAQRPHKSASNMLCCVSCVVCLVLCVLCCVCCGQQLKGRKEIEELMRWCIGHLARRYASNNRMRTTKTRSMQQDMEYEQQDMQHEKPIQHDNPIQTHTVRLGLGRLIVAHTHSGACFALQNSSHPPHSAAHIHQSAPHSAPCSKKHFVLSKDKYQGD